MFRGVCVRVGGGGLRAARAARASASSAALDHVVTASLHPIVEFPRQSWICRQPRLLEHIPSLPAVCMTSGRSLVGIWHEVLGQVQVQVLVHVVGVVLLVGFQASLRLP